MVSGMKPENMDSLQFAFKDFNHDRPFPFQNEKELPFSTRFFTIYTDKNHEITDYNLGKIASVDLSELESVKETVLNKNNDVGWYHSYRYRVSETDDGFSIVVLEATSTLSAVMYVLFVTLAVGIVSFVFIFAVIAVFSKRAIGPIAKAYDKQKQFITDAGHELKTPLTVISAYAEVLAMSYGENEWCNGIVRQTDTMRKLIGQMIQLAKLDESEIAQQSEPFSISEAITDTAMSFEKLAIHQGLHFDMDIEDNIDINGNEAAVRQLAAILVDNATKYCDPDGNIRISLSSQSKKNVAVLSVSNSFSAVDKLDMNAIFDRFYRASEAREGANSFGLGLSIAKSIMEQHEGSLICRKRAEKEVEFVATFKK